VFVTQMQLPVPTPFGGTVATTASECKTNLSALSRFLVCVAQLKAEACRNADMCVNRRMLYLNFHNAIPNHPVNSCH
jgi:hypothetical protein